MLLGEVLSNRAIATQFWPQAKNMYLRILQSPKRDMGHRLDITPEIGVTITPPKGNRLTYVKANKHSTETKIKKRQKGAFLLTMVVFAFIQQMVLRAIF